MNQERQLPYDIMDPVFFLQNSARLLALRKKSIEEILGEFKSFLPCYVDLLPVELKAIIIKKVIYSKCNCNGNIRKRSKISTAKSICGNILMISGFCGANYKNVIQCIIDENPFKILSSFRNNCMNVASIIFKLNMRNISLIGWNDGKRELICFMDHTSDIYRFRSSTDFDTQYITVHETESVVSRRRHNMVSSFVNYYTEGIRLDREFRPIHYIKKESILEFSM